ncbi:MAG: protease modulator HflC [Deltaproteobacteria bacterium]
MSRTQSILRTFGGLLVALIGVTAYSALYTIDESEQAIVVQFGRPVGAPITSPGLHAKIPFIQELRRFDRRIMIWDGDPNQVPTRGREFISVDTTARWRITDPLAFLKSVRDESGAQSRLDDIIDSVVRDRISSTELVEIVRSSDWEVTENELERLKVPIDEEDRDLTRRIEVGREELTRAMLSNAAGGVRDYGIELVDVRIKRLNYVPSVQKQVFNRMISERERIAEQFRSEGVGEASKIRGETSKLLAEIRSEAERKAQVLRGEADAEATTVYASAYSGDPEFYALYRTLETYRRTLGAGTTLVLSSDSDFLGYLDDVGRYGR